MLQSTEAIPLDRIRNLPFSRHLRFRFICYHVV